MTKKSRRAREKHHSRSTTGKQEGYSEPIKSVTAEPQSSAKISPDKQSPAYHYQYLKPELRRIGILAGAIIIVLIVLSIVLG